MDKSAAKQLILCVGFFFLVELLVVSEIQICTVSISLLETAWVQNGHSKERERKAKKGGGLGS
jgi:hypothetical protein